MSAAVQYGILSNIVRHTDTNCYAIARQVSGASPPNYIRIMKSTDGVAWAQIGANITLSNDANFPARQADFVLSGDIMYYALSCDGNADYYVGRFNVATNTSLQHVYCDSGAGNYPRAFVFLHGTDILAYVGGSTNIMGNSYRKAAFRRCTVGGAWGNATNLGANDTMNTETCAAWADDTGSVFVQVNVSPSPIAYYRINLATGAVEPATTNIVLNNSQAPLWSACYVGGARYEVSVSGGDTVSLLKTIFSGTSCTRSTFATCPSLLPALASVSSSAVVYDAVNAIWHVAIASTPYGTGINAEMFHAAFDGTVWTAWTRVSEAGGFIATLNSPRAYLSILMQNITASSVDIVFAWAKRVSSASQNPNTSSHHAASTRAFAFGGSIDLSAALTLPMLQVEASLEVIPYHVDISAALTLPMLQVVSNLTLYRFIQNARIQTAHMFTGTAPISPDDVAYVAEVDNGSVAVTVPMISFTLSRNYDALYSTYQDSLVLRCPPTYYAMLEPYIGQTLRLYRTARGMSQLLAEQTIQSVKALPSVVLLDAETPGSPSNASLDIAHGMYQRFQEGRVTLRAAPNFNVRPGSVISAPGLQTTVSSVAIYVSRHQQFMEVA